MSSTPAGFNIPSAIFADAVRYFWAQRDKQAASAHGGEGQGKNVRGGRHLDEVQAALVTLMIDHGVPPGDIFSNCELHKTGKLELPGFFRPTKQWDLLVVRDGHLLAAMEIKAQGGPSFGNNFNNRTEEAIGSATDLWTTLRNHGLATCFCWRTMKNPKDLSGIRNRTSMCLANSMTLPMPNDTNCSAGSLFSKESTTQPVS